MTTEIGYLPTAKYSMAASVQPKQNANFTPVLGAEVDYEKLAAAVNVSVGLRL